jgi:hypothetical protein
MTMFAWKKISTGEVLQVRICPTVEELFRESSFKLPVRDVSSAGYVVVNVVKGPDGKWIEEDEKERMWRAIVEFSSK